MTAYLVLGMVWLVSLAFAVFLWLPLVLYSFHWWFS